MIRALVASLVIFSCSVFAAPKVLIETNLGPFTIELNQEQAPISVDNFLKYVEDGSYVGTIFHRVIPGFMAQGGGFDKNMGRLGTYAQIRNEASNGLENKTATIAMARTSDPHSATRQFFINLTDNHFLNMSATQAGYAVFGKVTQGFEVVETMATKPTKTMGRMQDIPVDPIVITNVTLLK
ncbi:peptidylprolyl isomerase [Vibrio genomosp. F10]|uniref:Peptidyl-prolyl cis-trans isomerase n=1 Tax=Vibrio genomosp. F10 TaxID=723171 RepID=A0A1B9QY07_9VIBR|nr:peptidylprolyl isomerase [Vibrio genomosp. F10]OCH75173.1 peptidyl-prolyl cis-trans isomerase [Vibrio genomosp. F10]OEF04656.1 peptidyl-prolyl cis-trans isomerase [Vibrio genomosp. F10 str. 9ZD137]OEF09105.1 peptidyl-prolyl cis-trans isomerase [Vibrio genomosp. F10 str. 9ZB36]